MPGGKVGVQSWAGGFRALLVVFNHFLNVRKIRRLFRDGA